ncbi:UNVERIFIED_CONTAM: hypothetical protein GTU68_008959 [Idotea baltica]|nr:hypothetical protein [Idotea baltica]
MATTGLTRSSLGPDPGSTSGALVRA